MIPAVRLATHEIDELIKSRSREARLKRLQQVCFNFDCKFFFITKNHDLFPGT